MNNHYLIVFVSGAVVISFLWILAIDAVNIHIKKPCIDKGIEVCSTNGGLLEIKWKHRKNVIICNNNVKYIIDKNEN